MSKKIKPWYLLRDNDYSTRFLFFLKYQVLVVRHQDGVDFVSRLEALTFEHKTKHDCTEDEAQKICRQIHTRLLAGEYGPGIFTD